MYVRKVHHALHGILLYFNAYISRQDSYLVRWTKNKSLKKEQIVLFYVSKKKLILVEIMVSVSSYSVLSNRGD